MATQRENVRAGLFVLLGIVLGMAILFVLTDFDDLFQQRQQVRVYYRLDDGLQGLKAGAAVTLGDVPVGEVVAIRDFERDGHIIGQVVTFEIPSKYTVRRDAVVELAVPTFGSGTKLNISSLGTIAEPYTPDAVLDGTLAGNPLARQVVTDAGIDEKRREQIRTIIDNVAAITSSLRQDLPEITAGARRIVEKVEPLPGRADRILDELGATLADARSIVTAAKDRSETWFTRIDSVTASMDETLLTLRTLLKDKDPDLRATVEQVRALTARLNEETAPKLAAILDDAKVISAEARTLMVAQRPVIERALADMQLASGQLKLAMIEVRRSPWRLLYRPDKAEVASDNLYDAARSFAMAASALDSSAASLKAVVNENATDDQRIKVMLDYLNALFARFQDAEQAFWQQMEGNKP